MEAGVSKFDSDSIRYKLLASKEQESPGHQVADTSSCDGQQELENSAEKDPESLSDIDDSEVEGSAVPQLRHLKLEDFIQSKAKVGASVAYDAASMNELRKWNEKYGEGGSRKKCSQVGNCFFDWNMKIITRTLPGGLTSIGREFQNPKAAFTSARGVKLHSKCKDEVLDASSSKRQRGYFNCTIDAGSLVLIT